MSWLALTVVVTLGATPEATQLARGKALFAQRCAVCHGEGGKGDGVTASALKPPPADLTAARSTRARVIQVLEKGIAGTAMTPMRRLLTDAELEAMLAYVQSTYGTGAAVGVPPRGP